MIDVANPYIGPRAFGSGDILYGRDWEILQLKALLVAERIVLLHSPSGAGKTSLIQAGLIPNLAEENFTILPIIRINREPPIELAGRAVNRYLLSTFISLEELTDTEQRLPLEQLMKFDLDSYLNQRHLQEGMATSTLLIFDQFEEVLTTNPTDRDGKQIFFEQLGVALRNPNRWALFSMREEYLGAIAPYVLPIPNRLDITFRLDMLGMASAFQAIQSPARNVGVEFTNEATQKLVDDLRCVHVQQPDGTKKSVLGQYVEPVQLQVICYRLWQALPDNTSCIDEENITAVGDVDQSLADYYSLIVATAAKISGQSERSLREWFETKLITEEGFRGQVTMTSGNGDNTNFSVLRMFVDAHLVRGEKHSGVTWFELAHDRLIEPIKLDNATWFKENLSRLQLQSALWESQKQPESLLIRDDELKQANDWASDNKKELTNIDIQFLEKCNQEQKIRDFKQREALQQEKQRKEEEERRKKIIIGLLIGLVITIGLSVFAFLQRQIALNRLLLARVRVIDTRMSEMQTTKLGLAIEAYNRLKDDQGDAAASYQTLWSNTYAFRSENLRLHTGSSVKSICFYPDDKVFVSETDKNIIQVWDSESGKQQLQINPRSNSFIEENIKIKVICSPDGRIFAKERNDMGSIILIWDIRSETNIQNIQHLEVITDFDLSPDSKYIVSGSSDGRITLWDSYTGNEIGHKRDEIGIDTVIFNPKGDQVASANTNGDVLVWSIKSGKEIRIPTGTLDLHLLFSPDGHWLITGGKDGNVVFWDPLSGKQQKEVFLKEPISVLAYSPNGKLLYTASEDGAYKIWDTSKDTFVQVINGIYYGPVDSASFSPDSQYVIQGGMSGYAQVYGFGKLDRMGQAKTTYGVANVFGDGRINQVIFSHNGRKFVAATDVGEIIISPTVTNILNHDSKVWDVEFNKNNSLIITSSKDNTAKVWDVKTGKLIYELPHADQVKYATFNDDSSLVATASSDKTARVWGLADGKEIFSIDHDGEVSDVKFSPGGQYVGTASWDGLAKIWDVKNQTQVFTIKHDKKINHILFNEKRKWVVTASDDHSIQIWDLTDRKKVLSLFDSSSGQVTDIAISTSGKYIVSGDDLGNVVLWNTETGQKDFATNLGEGYISKVSFSSDSSLFAAGNKEGVIRVWQTDGKTKCHFEANEIINDIEFSQSEYVIVGSGDGYVFIWDLSSGKEYLRIGNSGKVLSLDISSDEKYLAVSTTTGVSWFAPWKREDVILEACNRLPHQLSLYVWKEYVGESIYKPFCSYNSAQK